MTHRSVTIVAAHDMPSSTDISTTALRAPFDAVTPFTIGLEEEAMLLHPATLDLLPEVGRVLERVAGDDRFKPELPAAQIELVTPPCTTVGEALGLLADGRRDLARAVDGISRIAVAGVHPFADAEGELNDGDRYAHSVARYGNVASRQLVAALQVHVAVGGADRTLAVHDALRCFLPELAAMAANAPFHDGRDTGMASVRPLLSQQLPRQGVPPAIGTWEALAGELRWGRRAGAVPDPSVWWWELRPHLAHGTLELRVPDAQTTLSEACGVTVTAQAIVAWLADCHDRGEDLPTAPDWRIAENRWSALRHGLDGELADLQTGDPVPTRERLKALLDTIGPYAEWLGSGALLGHAHALAERNGAQRQRTAAEDGNGELHPLVAWLADRYERPLEQGA